MAEENPLFNPDLTPDSGDEKQVKKRKLEAEAREKEDREVVATLLSSPNGRRWMDALLRRCHVFETIVPDEIGRIHYLLGERNIGLMLLAQVNSAAPEAIVQMAKERKPL